MNEWIEHDGKSMPVDGDTLVFVRFGDGSDDEKIGREPIKARWWHFWYSIADSNWVWTENRSSTSDIVAYKIVGE